MRPHIFTSYQWYFIKQVGIFGLINKTPLPYQEQEEFGVSTMLLDAGILFPGDICKILSEVSHFTYPNPARGPRPTSVSLFPTYRDISYCQLLWLPCQQLHIRDISLILTRVLWCRCFNPVLRWKTWGPKSPDCMAMEWQYWDLHLTLSPRYFLFLPSTIPTNSYFFSLLPSVAVPPWATSSVFSSVFFMGICLGSLSRLNLLMEGTLYLFSTLLTIITVAGRPGA